MSDFSLLEFKSTLLRDVRENRIDRGKAAALWSAFNASVTSYQYRILPLSKSCVSQVLELLDLSRQPLPILRAPDAVHIGTAIDYNRVGFVTADKQQATAARSAGLRTTYLGN